MPIFVVKMILVERSERFENKKMCTMNGPLNAREIIISFEALHYYVHLVSTINFLKTKLNVVMTSLRTREIVDQPIANSLLQINKLQPCTILYETHVTRTFIKINNKYRVSYLLRCQAQLELTFMMCLGDRSTFTLTGALNDRSTFTSTGALSDRSTFTSTSVLSG